MIRDLNEAERIVGDGKDEDVWVLIPTPIPALKDKRKEFVEAVKHARVSLVHNSWDELGEAARELSDAGGIENVSIYRVKTRIVRHSTFKDGKQIKLTLPT
jgi:hypothetical protein